jgi:drug/metabolite transporter (DMT)-like permease
MTVLAYGAYTVGLPSAIRAAGWVQTVLISRGLSAVLAWAVLFVILRRNSGPASSGAARGVDSHGFGLPGASPSARTKTIAAIAPAATLLIVLGGLNALGQLTRALALETAPAWLVGLVVSTSPAAVLATALLVLHERVGPAQSLGIGLIIVGLAFVAAG